MIIYYFCIFVYFCVFNSFLNNVKIILIKVYIMDLEDI